MLTPFSNILALAQAPGFVLPSTTAPQISTQFLATVRSLSNLTEAPDNDFEALFSIYAHTISLNNLTHAKAEDFLSDYSLISCWYCIEFFEQACTHLCCLVRVMQTYANEVKACPIPSDPDEREDYEMCVTKVEVDASHMHEELVAGEAQTACTEADRIAVTEQGTYHPWMFCILIDAAKVSCPPADAVLGPKLTIEPMT